MLDTIDVDDAVSLHTLSTAFVQVCINIFITLGNININEVNKIKLVPETSRSETRQTTYRFTFLIALHKSTFDLKPLCFRIHIPCTATFLTGNDGDVGTRLREVREES